jgi:predicted transcriptional regulator
MEEIPSKKTKELDHYCTSILLLLWLKDEMRFNSLFRGLKDWGISLSKPTLSDHLKHLTKKKLVTRRVKGVQNVTYALGKELIQYKKESEKESLSRIETFLKDSSLPEIKIPKDKQVTFELHQILRMRLRELLLVLGMESMHQKELISLNNPISRTLEASITSRCMKDNALRKLVSEKINELIGLFDWLDKEESADLELPGYPRQ